MSMMRPDASSKIVCIIGDPVAHSLSPAMHNAAFDASDLNWVYVAFRVDESSLAQAVEGLRALGAIGFNVTMPHKEAVAGLVDELDAEARIIGAVNTVQVRDGRLIGHNTDGAGLVCSLLVDLAFSVRGKNAVVFGAGGAARAIVVALASAGCERLTVVNRTKDKADILVELIRENFSACKADAFGSSEDYSDVMRGADLVVNATSVGMHGGRETPLDVNLICERHIVYDIVYNPEITALLAAASAAGAAVMGGKRLLLYQGMASFEIWTGRSAPGPSMESAL